VWTSVVPHLGILRDSAAARLLGAGWVSDAYFIAFRIPNMLRDLLAEGALSAAFVPAMTREHEHHGSEAAWKTGGHGIQFTAADHGALVLAGLAFSPQLVGLLAPWFFGAARTGGTLRQADAIMFPFLA